MIYAFAKLQLPLKALKTASIGGDLRSFASFIAEPVRCSIEQAERDAIGRYNHPRSLNGPVSTPGGAYHPAEP
jgi:hypothetical protein